MALHPQAKLLLERVAAAGRPAITELSIADARSGLVALYTTLGRSESLHLSIRDCKIPGASEELPARVYTPTRAGNDNDPLPLLLFIHGGGWGIGNIEAYDSTCKALAHSARCIVVAIEYRLAPEHKFPAAPDDCYAAACWLADHAEMLGGDPRRIAIGGDSAGGNLTAAVTLMARERSGPRFCCQLLIYPATQYDARTPSMAEYADGYLLTRDAIEWFWNHYLPDEEAGRNPIASPLLANTLSDLPPAIVVTAECDLLRDEGELYAQRLRDAGIAVNLKRYQGMIHGFISFDAVLDVADQAMLDIGNALRAAFARDVD